jgi:hypothetical protein
MVQLTILSGSRRGSICLPHFFPFRVGRGAGSDLCLDEPGVWPRHLSLDLRHEEGVWLSSNPEALTIVNGERVSEIRLSNGDLIEAGSARLRFSLKPAVQRGLRGLEILVWITLAGLCLGQVVLLWRVLP